MIFWRKMHTQQNLLNAEFIYLQRNIIETIYFFYFVHFSPLEKSPVKKPEQQIESDSLPELENDEWWVLVVYELCAKSRAQVVS